MKIYIQNKDDNKVVYLFESEYKDKDTLKDAGCKWEPKAKKWYTFNPIIVSNLINDHDFEYDVDNFENTLAHHVEEYTALQNEKNAEKQALIAASKSTVATADFNVPCGPGLDFLPYQKAGIELGLQRQNVLIGDEMGLGKTAQAIGIINGSNVQSVLIICTASLTKNWANEIARFGTRDLSVGFATTKTIDETDIIITTYDVFSRDNDINKILINKEYDLLILDECHYVKNYKSNRTQRILGENGNGGIIANKKVFMTGTPLMNRPIELWPVVHALDVHSFPNFMKFAFRYCDATQTRYGWDFKGASNLDELNEKLRTSVMIRRVKKDVLQELPAKIRQVIELPATTAAEKNALKQEAKYKAEYDRYVAQMKALEATKESTSSADYEAQVAKLKGENSSINIGEIAKLRHATALAKLPQCIDFIKNIMEEDEQQKIIVFAHHKDVIDGLNNSLEEFGTVKIDGSTDKSIRQDIVDAFQTDESKRIFIGSIHACSEGLTLTRANRVLFVEIDWTPAKMTQAEDRAHRIGQTDTVFVQHLLLENSYDANMAKTIAHKQTIIDKTIQ